ncbi:MAG: carbohydrate binding domain-containing protein [Tannerella sp.]|nr:carbohydrate binding domain-containing protein [Tannerella sp.]
MKGKIYATCVAFVLVFGYSCTGSPQKNIKWHHPLYMANNDYWRQRIPVTIQNNMKRHLMGDPVEFQIGNNEGQVPIAGTLAEGIRVTASNGTELTFRIIDSDENLVERGPVPVNSMIVLPIECSRDSCATNYIYFDNPSAWAAGDFYKTHREILNGGFEKETGYGPLGWEFSLPEGSNLVEYVRGESRTGNRSIKISVNTPDLSIPYGATQRNLHLLSGIKYMLEGWIKGEDIKGEAQMAVVFGDLNSENFKLGTRKISGGNGTFGWRKITLEFVTPEKVSGANLQLFLEGTGQVWFDNLKINCFHDYDVITEVLKKEKLSVKEIGKTDEWFDDHPNDQSAWQSRAAIKTVNFQDNDMVDKLVCVDIEGIINRLHAEINENSMIQITNGTEPISFYQVGDYILFRQDVKGFTEQTNYIYFNSGREGVENIAVKNREELYQNLLQNPDFENPDLSGWRVGQGIAGISTESKKGTKSVKLNVTDKTAREVMIEQTLPVQSGRMYFFSTWMKCTDMIKQPDFLAAIGQRTLRAQFIAKDGAHIGKLNRIAVNPERHIDHAWSQLYMLITAPSDADSVKLQLVNAAPGTVWFDDVIFTDIIVGTTCPMAIERLGVKNIKELTVWQEDPIVKVFQDDLPPSAPGDIAISLARNEVEPLQLVLRSPQKYKQVEIKISHPVDAEGNRLEQIETGIVGYVPINYPSNYITDRANPIPCWHQKIPGGKIGSDGWSGMWPDPILPFHSFDIHANTTQPVWIEIKTPQNAVPGDYIGHVQLIHDGEVIKEIPFKVHVWDFELPDESHMVAEYDARVHTWEFFGYAKSETDRMKEIWKMLADHRLCADAITPAPVWKIENGQIIFDFTEFDRSAEYYFDRLKLPRVYSPWYFYLFGWANLPEEKFGEKPYPGEFPYPGVDRSKLRPEFKKAYQSALRTFWNHMKEKGWADKVIFYISDEPHADIEITRQMQALCDMIHEVDPTIPIYVSTWWYRPEYKGYVDVWGVSNHGGGWGRPVPEADLIKIKQIGGRLWFTTDGKMCTDTPYLGFERLLPYFCFKYGAEEYEFWGSNWYTFNPYEYGWHSFIRQSDRPGDLYWIRYPNGDANFIYPGLPIGMDSMVPTIRLKLAREGVEDYEYLYCLESLVSTGKKQGKDIRLGEKALENAKKLVTVPSSEGRYSTEYLPDPYVVLQVRKQVGEAIENLLKQVCLHNPQLANHPGKGE